MASESRSRSPGVFPDAMLESRAIQKFHGDESLAILLANVVDGADVGMIESRRRLGFALKAGRACASRAIIGEKFEGDETMEAGVLGLVDDAHAAAAELLDDAVVRDGLADHAEVSYVGNVGKSMKAEELTCGQRTLLTYR